MGWQYTPFTAPLVVVTGAVLLAAAYVVRQQRAYKPVPGGYNAVGLGVVIAWSLLTYALQLSRVDQAGKLFWFTLSFAGVVAVPPLLFAFTLRYTNTDEWLNRWTVGGLVLVPVVMVALGFTNEMHTLVWRDVVVRDGTFAYLQPDHGPAMGGFLVFTYLLIGVSIGLLARRAIETAGIYRRQAIILVAGSSVPLVTGAVYLRGLNPFPQLEIMTVSLAVTALTFCWAVARHGLFTLVPIASQAAVEQMDEGVIVIDVRGLVVNVNPEAEQFLTVDPGAAIGQTVGGTLRPFAVPPAPRATDTQSDREVVNDPETGRYYQRTGTPLTDDDGVLMGQLIVLQDITERFQREKRLRQQNEQLEEFASVVSHDLRNPLNVISARTQLARETGDDEHFDALADAADRMDRLIDDLLKLARQGQTVDETEQVDLRTVAEDAWQLVEAPEASLEIKGEMAVEADRDRLQQAFENLFRNATDHVDDDVALVVEPLEDGFAVEDDGPGIPDERQDQVFEYGHTSEPDGTGFGLAIVREIVEAHGWDIRVINGDMVRSSRNGDDSEYGGARFEISGVTTARSFAIGADESGFEFG